MLKYVPRYIAAVVFSLLISDMVSYYCGRHARKLGALTDGFLLFVALTAPGPARLPPSNPSNLSFLCAHVVLCTIRNRSRSGVLPKSACFLTSALDHRKGDGNVARHGLLLREGASLHPGLPLRPVLLPS